MKNPIRILYIEDNTFDRELIHENLSGTPCSITDASSRTELEKILAENEFDIVLSDFNILGFTGLDVIKIIKEKFPSLPIVIVTGTGSEEIAVEAIKQGAADYIIKTPRHIQRLRASIDAVLAQKQAENEKAELQERLKQAQKMEIIGRMAGSVAHDFNNLLTVIFANVDTLQERHKNDARTQKELAMILEAADMAAKVTKSLLTFSRKIPTEKKRVDLCSIVDKSAQMLGRMLPASIGLEVKYAKNEPVWVHADATQIQQIIMNLGLNARDAMADKGKIGISVQTVSEDAAAQHQENLPEDTKYAQILVSDNGTGMDENVKSSLFEPFFSTKEHTEGTGLGLSIVYGIVKDHSGWVNVESAVGRGTVFNVFFPLCGS